MSNTDTNATPDIQALLNRARGQLAEITPGPWGTGEHVDEPRAVCKEPQGLDNLLALDKDGMAIFERATDAAFVVDVRNGLLAALCDALEAEHRRAETRIREEINLRIELAHDLHIRLELAEAGAAALREVLNKILAGEGYDYEPENGYEQAGSKEEAAACASVALEQCRDASSDYGWHENTDSIEWGVMIPLEQAEEVDREDVDREEDPSSEFDYTCNYVLRPTPIAVSIQAALAADAGRALLDRLAAAERRAAEAESGRDEAEAQAAALVDALTTSIVAHDTPVPPESWHAALNTFHNKVTAGRAFLERLHAAEGQNLQAWEEISSLHHAADQSAAQVKIVDLMLQDEPNPEDFRSRRILRILKERDTLRETRSQDSAHIVRLEAEAAAMRQAIEAIYRNHLVPLQGAATQDPEQFRCRHCFEFAGAHTDACLVGRALAADAGRMLLDDLNTAREARDDERAFANVKIAEAVDLRQVIADLEAQASALRRALMDHSTVCLCCSGDGNGHSPGCLVGQALAPDAGRAFLDELHAVSTEKARMEALYIRYKHDAQEAMERALAAEKMRDDLLTQRAVLGPPCPSCGARPQIARSCGCNR